MSSRATMRCAAAGAATAMLLGLAACGGGDTAYEVTVDDENIDKLVMSNQPESPYWFPEDLLAWTPESDADLAYNVSTVPLAERVADDRIVASNDTQNDDTKVMAISIMNSSTSGNAPHGLNSADANTFTYWQYVDELVYWGGSAGEGIIVPPSPDVTDEGHRNGVPVLGTVFFPQDASGGKVEWVREFLEQDADGSFPMADKLIEAAETYGFDGWFINQETEGEDAEVPLDADDAKAMQAFISYYKAQAPGMRIVYYDSMTRDGAIDWQNALTDENAMFMVDDEGDPVADEMFLNFWWTEDELADRDLLAASAAKAEELGVDPYSLYAGVDVQANGIYTPIRWDLFSDADGVTRTSLGLYCPNWAYTDAGSLDEFHENEASLWVNADHDPTAASKADSDEDWSGVSTYVKENSAVTALPLVTNFNTGSGYNGLEQPLRRGHPAHLSMGRAQRRRQFADRKLRLHRGLVRRRLDQTRRQGRQGSRDDHRPVRHGRAADRLDHADRPRQGHRRDDGLGRAHLRRRHHRHGRGRQEGRRGLGRGLVQGQGPRRQDAVEAGHRAVRLRGRLRLRDAPGQRHDA